MREGDTRAKRLEKGAMPLEQVLLKFGAQIADALDKSASEPAWYTGLEARNIC